MSSAPGSRAWSLVVVSLLVGACQALPSTPSADAPESAAPASRPPSAAGSPSAVAVPSGKPAVPAGFPLPAGAEPASFDQDQAGLLGAWQTADVGPDVYDFYLESLPSAGFEVIGQFPGGAAAIVRFRAPRRVLDVSLTGDLDGTRIELRVAGD